jgi:hypothetical protein
MIIRWALSCFAAVSLLGTAAQVSAEIPVGAHDFDVADIPVWDIAGTYDEEVEGLSTTYTITSDAGGKFTAVGSAVQDDAESHVEATFTFTGAMKSAGPLTRVTANWKMNGTVEVDGIVGTFTATIKQNLEIDPIDLQMIGTASGKIKITVPGEGSESLKLDPDTATIDLPDGMNGGWALSLDIANLENKHSGTGTVQLSNGDTYPLGLTGTYSAKTDLSKLTLKGTGLNAALSLKLATSSAAGQMTIQTLKGKLLGQSVISGPGGYGISPN